MKESTDLKGKQLTKWKRYAELKDLLAGDHDCKLDGEHGCDCVRLRMELEELKKELFTVKIKIL